MCHDLVKNDFSLRCQDYKLFITLILAPVVQRLDNVIYRINRYPVDSVVCFVNTYPLDSDLSGG